MIKQKLDLSISGKHLLSLRNLFLINKQHSGINSGENFSIHLLVLKIFESIKLLFKNEINFTYYFMRLCIDFCR